MTFMPEYQPRTLRQRLRYWLSRLPWIGRFFPCFKVPAFTKLTLPKINAAWPEIPLMMDPSAPEAHP